jgi:hypothetical protein
MVDETEKVLVQEAREKFIVSKLIYKIPDDIAGYEPRKELTKLNYLSMRGGKNQKSILPVDDEEEMKDNKKDSFRSVDLNN